MVDTTPQPNVQKLVAIFGKKEEPSSLVSTSTAVATNGSTTDPPHLEGFKPVIAGDATFRTLPHAAKPAVKPKPACSTLATLQKNSSFLDDLNHKLSTENKPKLNTSPRHPSSEPTSRRESQISSQNVHCDKFSPPRSMVHSYHSNFTKRPLQRKALPSLESLGPPPEKPFRPDHLSIATEKISCPVKVLPSHPAPPLPTSPPPLPSKSSTTNLLEEDLYEDAALIPEYTEEEEYADKDLYDDTTVPPVPLTNRPQLSSTQLPLASSTDGAQEEEEEAIYNDVVVNEDQLYEVPSLPSSKQTDITHTKRDPKILKEEERRLKNKKKEEERIKKKFGVVGEVIHIGLVKSDVKGGRLDLAVSKGERVRILRMEDNPMGKWLAKNDSDKIGYVEVTNIEVDADSVKSIMSNQKDSKPCDESVYYEPAEEEEEGIYETPR